MVVAVRDEREVEVESFAGVGSHSSPDAAHDAVLERVASPELICVGVVRGQASWALCRAC